MPDLYDQAFGATAKRKDLFQEAFGAQKQTGGKDLFGEAFGQGKAANDLPALEAEAEAVGAPAPAQDSPGLFRRALDILSRPNYAVAGAAEELFAPQGGGLKAVPGRVANELLSGIGSFKGQKEGFGQVLEQSGVPELGHFSDLIPALYNETGEGIQFQRGGWADPTGRGAIGLGLDIAADPTTYLTAGTGKGITVGGRVASKKGAALVAEEAAKAAGELSIRAKAIKAAKALDPTLTSEVANSMLGKTLETAAPGLRNLAVKEAKARVAAAIEGGATGLLDPGGIRWMGIRIAPTPLEVIAKSGVSPALSAQLSKTAAGRLALDASGWMKENIADPLKTMFLKGYGIRGLEGAQRIIDDATDKAAYLRNAMHGDIMNSPLAKWGKMSDAKRDAIFKPVVDAFQAGGMAAVPDEFKPAMAYLVKSFDSMFGEEVKSGLLQSGQHRPNYFAHYYDNTPEELAKVIVAGKGGLTYPEVVANLLKMGRNAEERAYDNLAEAVSKSTYLHGQNPAVPILRPIYDPVEVLRRRWDHSIQKRVNVEMAQNLGAKFGRLPFNVNEVYAAAKPAGKLSAQDFTAIKTALAGGDNLATLGKVSDTGKQAFFNERFQRIGSREELNNVLQKYQGFEQYFPKQISDPGFYAADGSHFIQFNAGKYTGELPETLAREVAGLADTTLTSPALRKLLQGYDTVNNIWKGSVTWLFPAFHVRNAYSNVAQAFVDIGIGAVDPASYKQTAEILFGKSPGVFKTKLGNYTYDEVRDILNRHGIVTSGDALAEFTGNQSKLLRPFKGARNVGTAIENESRAQLALNYLRRGMDPEEVGARVKKFQLDYANGLTNFERTWMKRVIPFYCVPDHSEILTATGWKRVDDLSIGESALTYSMASDSLEWQAVDDIAVFDGPAPITVLTNSHNRIEFTSDHRWVAKSDYNGRIYETTGDRLRSGTSILVAAEFVGDGPSLLTPAQAQLFGWLLTDGYWRWRGAHCEAMIYQHPSKFLDEVKAVAGGKPRRPHPDSGVVCVPVLRDHIRPLKWLLRRSKTGVGWIDVLSRLNRPALDAMYDAMYKGDGLTVPHRKQDFFAAQLDGVADTFQVLATLRGNRAKRSRRGFCVSKVRGTKVSSYARTTETYLGRVWCPSTANGTWVMRQNGLVTITGNTFQRLNLGLQLDNMLKRPGALLAELKPFRGREDENAQMTSWDAGALKMRLNRDGKNVQMITGIDLPIRNLDLIFRGNGRDTIANAIGMLSPLIKTPIEFAAGKSLFTGRDFDRANAPIAGRAVEQLPKPIQQWMGYKKEFDKAGRPQYSFDAERYYLLAQAGVTSRFLSTSDRLFKQYTQSADGGHLKMLLDFATGLRWQDMNLDEEQAARVRERTADLERALVRWGERKEFQRVYKPKGAQ